MTTSSNASKKPVRYMDFVGGRRSSSTDPLLSRSQKKPAPKPEPPKKPQASPHSVSAVRFQNSPEPLREPKILYSKKPILEEKSTKAKLERTSRPKTPQKTIKIADGKSTPKPLDDLAQKASTALSSSKKSFDAPDNNLYSLSGKSPFLTNYAIDKRPLSDSVPTKKNDEDFEKLSFLGVSDPLVEKSNKKNTYEKKEKKSSEKKKKEKHAPVTIIDDSAKKSGLPLAIVIIVTVLLGAAVGAGIYFLLPK